MQTIMYKCAMNCSIKSANISVSTAPLHASLPHLLPTRLQHLQPLIRAHKHTHTHVTLLCLECQKLLLLLLLQWLCMWFLFYILYQLLCARLWAAGRDRFGIQPPTNRESTISSRARTFRNFSATLIQLHRKCIGNLHIYIY